MSTGAVAASLRVRAVVLTCVVLIATLISPESRANAAENELAGTTIVRGDRTVGTTVFLPRAVTISRRPFGNPFASASTKSELAGVVLREDVNRRPVEASFLSIDPCEDGRCMQERLEFVDVNGGGSGAKRTARLPAGRYVLYLISDGSLAEITLRFPGLGGTTTVEPSSDAKSSFTKLEPGVTGDDAKVVYNASARQHIDRVGLSLVALEVESDAHLVGHYGTCTSPAQEGAPPQDGYHVCGGWAYLTPNGAGGRAVIVGLAHLGAGDYDHSASFEAAALTTSVRSFGFVLNFDRGRGNGSLSSTFSFDENP